MTKEIKTRVMNKIGTQTKWGNLPDFVPLEGEAIVYTNVDNNPRNIQLKFGDGETTLAALPFVSAVLPRTVIAEAPVQSNSLTYSGSQQSPTWLNYDEEKMFISGVTSATDAGDYTVYFTPMEGFCWSDGKFYTKTVHWSINKATRNVMIEDTYESGNLTEIDVSTGGAAFVVVNRSKNDSIQPTITCSLTNAEINLDNNPSEKPGGSLYWYASIMVDTDSGGFPGSITVAYPETTNYLEKTVTATLTCVNNLNAYSWEAIKEIANAGTASSIFSVGDTKKITVSGTIGTITVNETFNVYILDFPYSDITGQQTVIHFGTFKTLAGISVGLTDSNYHSGLNDTTKYFNMNHGIKTNAGGWKSCDLRYDILGSTNSKGSTARLTSYDIVHNPVENTLMAALPLDLRNVMQQIKVYTDNRETHETDTENLMVSYTWDYLPLLAACEIFNRDSLSTFEQAYICGHEKGHQVRYAYYVNGNPAAKYKANDTTASIIWWLRSPVQTDGNVLNSFCCVSTNGTAITDMTANKSMGVAPIFAVG